MTEQFRFDQLFRDGGHVQRHKGLLPARAVPMQGMGNQFFTGAGFSVDQHRDVGIRQTPDGAEHLLHGGCFPDNFGRGRLNSLCRLLGFVFRMGQRPTRHGNGFINIEGLRQILEGASAVGSDRALQIRMRSHDDNRQFRVGLLNRGEQFQSVDARHPNVADNGIRRLLTEPVE